MATANASAAGGAANLAFTYDALGRRVSKSDGVNTTVYVCNSLRVIAEYRARDNPITIGPQQVYSYGVYEDEPLAKIDSTNGILFYHANRLYCITALSNSGASVVERDAYTAYGVSDLLSADGAQIRSVSSINNPLTY